MDRDTFDKGYEIRCDVLGKDHVDAAFAAADEFTEPFQNLLTEYCWGAIWGREGLSRQTRSMLNLAMLAGLNRPHEIEMHVRGALNNGLSRDDIREVFMHVAIYAGVPAAVDAFRVARRVFDKLDGKT